MTPNEIQLIADVLRYDWDNADLYPDTEIRKAGCAFRAKRMANAISKSHADFDRYAFYKKCGVYGYNEGYVK